MSRVRAREYDGLPALDIIYNDIDYWTGDVLSTHNLEAFLQSSTETCTDEVHPGPPYKTGGPLLVHRREFEANIMTWEQTYHGPTRRSEGSCRATNSNLLGLPALPVEPFYSTGDLVILGTEGWAKYRPLRPNMDLNQFIGELRDFPRLLRSAQQGLSALFKQVRSARDFRKSVADGYLTWEFGLKPIISDLLAMKEAYEFTQKRIKFIRDNNGKVHKRGGPLRDFEDSETETGTKLIAPMPAMVLGCYANYINTRTETYSAERKVWFEGAFGFSVPIQDSPRWEQKMFLEQGLGLNLSTYSILQTLYQLTPWTWLADWFTSMGDIIDNWAAINNYGVYSRYAYVMASESYTKTYSHDVSLKNGPTKNLFFRETVEFKQRLAASPFGFGINIPGDLTAWQLSILTALGLSRS